jgi:DNA-binding protein
MIENLDKNSESVFGLQRKKNDLVIIGMKPIMNYVVACLTLFNDGTDTVRVRARGKHISKAVEIVSLLQRIFLKDLKVDNVEISTDLLKRNDGKNTNVSVIEILLFNQ